MITDEQRDEAVTLGNLSNHLQARGVAPARPGRLAFTEADDEES
jgi:hypothetical protein